MLKLIPVLTVILKSSFNFKSLWFKINTMITKTQLKNSLDNPPENVTVDQVIDQLIFIEKIQKGLDDSKSGRTTSKEKAKEK